MHPILFYLSVCWLGLLLGAIIIQVVGAKTPMGRILAFDTLSLILVSLLALFALFRGSVYYLDAALVLALLSFMGTLAAARYHSQGSFFHDN